MRIFSDTMKSSRPLFLKKKKKTTTFYLFFDNLIYVFIIFTFPPPAVPWMTPASFPSELCVPFSLIMIVEHGQLNHYACT